MSSASAFCGAAEWDGAAMRGELVVAGALLFSTIGVANADPLAGFSTTVATVQLTSAYALPHSNADEQLRKESARANDRVSGGFRTELEAFEASVDIPTGLGTTPAGNLRATRLMLSGLYELRSGGWRIKPYVGAGFGVIDLNTRLLGHQETSLVTDVQFKGGLNYNITQKLLGSFEWRWSHGSKPTFAFAGVPTKFQLKRGGFMLGVNYKLQ
jgi:opacity protein-like surface antigen